MDLYVTTPDNIEHYLEISHDDTIKHVLDKIPESVPGYLTLDHELLNQCVRISDTAIESQTTLEWKPSFRLDGDGFYPPMKLGDTKLSVIVSQCSPEHIVMATDLALNDAYVEIDSLETIDIIIIKECVDVFLMLLSHPRVYIDPEDTCLMRQSIRAQDDTFLELLLKDGRIDPLNEACLVNLVCELGYDHKLQLFIDDPRTFPTLTESKGILSAITDGHLGIVRILIENGVDPHHKSVLRNAVEEGQLAIVKLLVDDYNVDPSAHYNIAIRNISDDSYDVLVYLLADGRADPSANNDECLDKALDYRSTRMIVALIRDPRVNAIEYLGINAKSLPSINNHAKFARMMIDWDRANQELKKQVNKLESLAR